MRFCTSVERLLKRNEWKCSLDASRPTPAWKQPDMAIQRQTPLSVELYIPGLSDIRHPQWPSSSPHLDMAMQIVSSPYLSALFPFFKGLERSSPRVFRLRGQWS